MLFAYLVAILVLPKGLTFLLNGIVGEMNHGVLDVGETVFIGWCPDVPIPIPIALQNAIHRRQEDETSNVEFTVLNPKINPFLQETIFYVFLENHSSLKMLIIFTQTLTNFPQNTWFIVHHCDSMTSVRVLPWLTDPQISTTFLYKGFITSSFIF